MEYKSGERVAIKFHSKNFRPKYLSHITTLCTMYKIDPDRLSEHCRQMATVLQYILLILLVDELYLSDRLHSQPFNTLTQAASVIQSRIPTSLIELRYRRANTQAVGSSTLAPGSWLRGNPCTS
jgi:hypothetical protein